MWIHTHKHTHVQKPPSAPCLCPDPLTSCPSRSPLLGSPWLLSPSTHLREKCFWVPPPSPFSFLRVGPPRSNLCPLLRMLAALLGAWHNKGRRAWSEPEPYPYPSAWPSSVLTYLPAAAADTVPW